MIILAPGSVMQDLNPIHTMVCDDNVEPPMFARAGAVRWISKKVVMNGAEIWVAFVKYGSADAPKDENIVVKVCQSIPS